MNRPPQRNIYKERPQKNQSNFLSPRAVNTETRVNRKKRHKILPVLIAGTIVFFAAILIMGFIWSLFAYFTKSGVTDATIIPAGIFLAAIFTASFFLAFILEGRHILPIIMLIIIISALSLLLAGFKDISLRGLIIKTAAGLICGLGANYILFRLKKAKNRRKNPSL